MSDSKNWNPFPGAQEEFFNSPVESAEVHTVYSPDEQAARDRYIELIEAEQRAYFERIEPYIRALTAIKGTPRIVIKTGLR